jgi:hypothetical protein
VTPDGEFAALITAQDRLEDQARGYVRTDELLATGVTQSEIDAAIAAQVLLVDQRRRFDVATETFHPITLCRLNRRHPLLAEAD